MKVKEEFIHAKVIRHFSVTDGPIVAHQYSSTGKRARVETVAVTYRLTPDGTWEAGSNFSVQVTGPVLKKDGTAGKQTYQGSPPWGYWDDPRYAWLVDIVNLGRPTGRIAMLAVDGAIIPDPA